MSDYREQTYLKKDSLIIIEPGYQLTGWVLVSGSVWRKVVTDIPSRLVRNSTELTLVGALVDLDTATKYFYDGTYVYIYTYAVDDFVVFYYEQYYGSRGFKLPYDLNLAGTGRVVYFEPRITGNPSFTRTARDWLSGVAVNGDANFSLIETDDHLLTDLYTKLDTESYINKRVRIYRYLDEEDIRSITLIFSGVIESWNIGTTSISFTAKDYLYKLDAFIQSGEYNTTDYPNVDPNMVGKVIRWIYGVKKVKCVNVSYLEDNPTETDNRIWKVAQHPCKAIDAVWIRDTLLTLTTDYTVHADNNQITLANGLETALGWEQVIAASEEVFVVVQGKKDGLGALINNAADILQEILLSIGFSASDLNTASFAQAKIDCPYKIGLAMPQTMDSERPTAREILEQINRTVMGFISNDDEFKIKFKIYATGAPAITLDKDTDLVGRTISANTMDMASVIVINYDYNERTQLSLSKTGTSKKAKYLHENGKSNTIETLLYDEADAALLNARYMAIYENPFIANDFRVALQLDQNHIGDFLEIDSKTYEIIKLDKSIKDISVQARRT
jgi:hypothetical protein